MAVFMFFMGCSFLVLLFGLDGEPPIFFVALLLLNGRGVRYHMRHLPEKTDIPVW